MSRAGDEDCHAAAEAAEELARAGGTSGLGLALVREFRSRGARVAFVARDRSPHSASRNGAVHAGAGLANQRIGPGSRLAVVDAIVTGTHEAGTSHYALLRAFASDGTLRRMSAALDRNAYRTHEFGDSVLLERALARDTRFPRVDRDIHERGEASV